ncbi:hypothetical protein NUW54_g9456 [Trametes sanguinea]|uniref:Uncharacterized protein n=1 Tax=Trametes sanguinea TaxID=158606 RepID=A0ACC1P7C9_9APHY|nr:hypothetical protein NUW54_g9456 [Trametes sanguinea]
MGELSHPPSSINLRIDVGAASCIAEDERWWTPMDAVSMFIRSTCSAPQGKCGSALWMWGPKVSKKMVRRSREPPFHEVGCKVAAYLRHAWQLSCNVTFRRSSQQSASAPFGILLLLCIRLFGDPTSVLATWRRRVILRELSNLRTKFWGARAVAALWSIFATSPSVLRDAAALCTDRAGSAEPHIRGTRVTLMVVHSIVTTATSSISFSTLYRNLCHRMWATRRHVKGSKLDSNAILVRCEVEELRELRRLRGQGWRDDRLDKHFSSQRQRADRPPIHSQQYWYREMANIMDELDTAAEFIPKLGPLDFLDLGCAPGGFSLHVLRTNPEARGVGLSLSESQGGHAFLLDESYRSRFEHKEQDLLEYDHFPQACHAAGALRRTLPTAFLGHFDLVVMDGQSLRTYHPSNVPDTPYTAKPCCFALLLTQLIIALSSVRPGGTIVAKMFHPECYPAAHLIYLLDASR